MSHPSLPDRSPALATIGFVSGPRQGDQLAVTSRAVTIGKGAENDIVLDDDSVSTRHAQLKYESGGWRIIDLDSTNGTYVEGIRLAPQVPTPLTYGASIRVGGVALQLMKEEGADADAAGAEEAAPAAPDARRVPGGFRLPVWVLLLVLIVLILAVLVYRWTSTPPADLPVPETVALLLNLPEPTKCL